MPVLTKYFRVNGTLTAATSVKLSSADGTYGVKRNDTSAVVVADDTAMSTSATGIYSYSFDDPATDLTYTVSYEVVYAGETYHSTEQVSGASSAATFGYALTLKQLAVGALDYLGFNGGAVDDAWLAGDGAAYYAKAKAWANEAAQELADMTGWWWLEKSFESLSVSQDAYQIDLPDGFRRFLAKPAYQDEDYWFEPLSLDQLAAMRADDTSSSTPVYYDVSWNPTTERHQLIIHPPANEAKTLKICYARVLPKMASESSTPAMPPNFHPIVQIGTIAFAEERHSHNFESAARHTFKMRAAEAMATQNEDDNTPRPLRAHAHRYGRLPAGDVAPNIIASHESM